MAKILTYIFFLFITYANALPAQISFRVMSYNVENLFDTNDNPLKADNEYLPSGNRHWTKGRYYHKLQQIAKVISAAGEWNTPAVIGLCEVENDSVLLHLLHRTPLKQQHYRYCMTHGEDTRGINVALLYQRDQFGYLGHTEYPVRFTRNQHKKTRNILHVWGKLVTGHILDLFVCHFPSRYGGEKESEQDRFDTAQTVRFVCDSLRSVREEARILLMGDFNDTPDDPSIREKLSASPFVYPCPPGKEAHLFNLFSDPRSVNFPGSHKYQGEWSQLDQLILTGNLLKPDAPIRYKPGSARIFNSSFLLTKDKTWLGIRPKRTYYGFKYEAGYSDHLPLIADFLLFLPNHNE